MLIHILEDGIEKDVEESELVRTDVKFENEAERSEAVEYRRPGSDVIVHRSVHVTVKQWPHGITAEVASFLGGKTFTQ
jgi:hypothetical protein